MSPPVVFVLILWSTLDMVENRPRAFEPYDGPLADRRIYDVSPHYGTNFSIDADTPALLALAASLRRQPIYVRAPGEKYVVFGLKPDRRFPDMIGVVRANLLLDIPDQPLGPFMGHAGQMLAWAFSVLDHYGLEYDPLKQGRTKDRQELLDWYHRESEPVDWKAVEARLRATGRPVPPDLYDEHP